ncbi:MAG: glycosyltransferase 61 family protein [Nocardioidaceae bacterium]
MKARLRAKVRSVRHALGSAAVPASQKPAPPAPRRPPGLVGSARRGGWEVDVATAALLRDLGGVLHERRPPKVAVLVDGPGRDWRAVLTGTYPRAVVDVVDVSGLDASGLHARLAAAGRLDAIVDDAAREAQDVGTLKDVLFHLRSGGALLVRLPLSRGDGSRSADVDPWTLVTDALSAPPAPEGGSREERDRRALAAGVSGLRFGPGHLTVLNRDSRLAKLREDEMDTVLELRGSEAGVVHARLPEQEFTSLCVLRENTEVRDARMPAAYSVPAMSLREYHDVVCLPRQIVVQRAVLAPDSFRYNAAPRLVHRYLEDAGPRFADVPAGLKKARPLTGTYFHLDSEWTGHFGHAMTEQMSRLWALEEAQRLAPGLRGLVSRRRSQEHELMEFEIGIFEAAGLSRSDIVLYDAPVQVEHLMAASPMFSMPTHVHPGLAEVWKGIGDRLVESAPEYAYARRIFCSRRLSRRACHNLDEVEAFFESYGFVVTYPEELTFAEQARTFREAEVIAGFAGSALFTSCFSVTPRHLVILSPTSYPARNEYMICAVLGHQLDFVWSRPDAEEVRGPDPRYAGFRFDFEAEGVFLREVLESL